MLDENVKIVDYVKLSDGISALVKEVQNINERISQKSGMTIYTNKALLELLQINTSTLRKYRDEGYLGYSKVGDKYYYTEDDVTRFLTTNHFEPFAN